MNDYCPHICGWKQPSGICGATACMNPLYRGYDICPAERGNPTNFDNITASPEALAKYIDWAIDEAWDGRCPLIKSGKCAEHLKCKDCITDWLKQKAEKETEE